MSGTEYPTATRQGTTPTADLTEQPRLDYQAPRVTPLGGWKTLTLANSVPNDTGLPAFLNHYS